MQLLRRYEWAVSVCEGEKLSSFRSITTPSHLNSIVCVCAEEFAESFFLPIIHCWCAHTWSVGRIFALAVPLCCGGSVELDAAPHSPCPFPHVRSPASPVSDCTRRLCLLLWLFHRQHILKGRTKSQHLSYISVAHPYISLATEPRVVKVCCSWRSPQTIKPFGVLDDITNQLERTLEQGTTAW